MSWKAWIYFGFTALLTAVLTGVIVYLYRGKRKDKIEAPKYRMLDDED